MIDDDYERYAGVVLKEMFPERSDVFVDLATVTSPRRKNGALRPLAAAALVAAVCAMVAVLHSSAGGRHASPGTGSVRPTAVSSTPNYDTTPSGWATRGVEIVRNKASMATLHPNESPGNGGLYAYASAPIDIAHDGRYVLQFGPIDPGYLDAITHVRTYDFPQNALGVGSDAFDVGGVATPFVRGGKTYVRLILTVTGLERPYRNFVMWIY